MTNTRDFRRALLLASALSAVAVPGAAFAQDAAAGPPASSTGASTSADTGTTGFIDGAPVDTPNIVSGPSFNPNAPPPAGILDPVNITGIGQVVTDSGGGFVGTCTGTLINPRTVIFAAHCVNTRPAEAYGAASGGTGISVGFQNYNLLALRRWLGLDGGTLHATDTSRAIYNVEQVWYDPRSKEPISCTNPSSCFLQADIAIATLDTPAFDIPTWAMLFTPLTEQEHVTVAGYGSTGTNASIFASGTSVSGGFRRRAAENLVSLLGSMQDRNAWLFGSISGAAPQMTYMVSLTDPNPNFGAPGKFDFGIFGPDDVAQPREGMGAPGDSGGPLILDQKYSMPLVLGVLSGSSRFFGAQPSNTYGTHSFYQPLYAFWETIVANNPYVYAVANAGDAEWTDASHWVQAMDPAYMIDVEGSLVNSLPGTPEIGTERTGAAFGQICFLTDCVTLSGEAAEGDGGYLYVPGGPGSTDFVPNNVVGNPAAGVKSRYYDVTLSNAGTTRLSNANITIDRLTIAGPSKLDIASSGSLKTWGDFTQVTGWTNVDGSLTTGEALLVSGILSGSGTFKAPWLTTASVIVAPGGADNIGTLTIDGNMVMASGSALYVDAGRSGADKLSVTGGLLLSSDANGQGPSVVFNKAKGAAPRHGQSFVIASAAGGLSGTFGEIFSFQGVLRPELTYGPNDVTAELRAGSLVTLIDDAGGSDATSIAFAQALDTLRDGSYNSLWTLYGSIDLMDAGTLGSTLSALSPSIVGETLSLTGNQGNAMMRLSTDRLSVMGTANGSGLSMAMSDGAMAQLSGATGASPHGGMASLVPSDARVASLPGGLSGFVASGTVEAGASYGAQSAYSGQRSSYFASGLEVPLGDNASIGTSVGIARGSGNAEGDRADSRMTQMAAYGAYRLGGGAYAGIAASSQTASVETTRGIGLSLDGRSTNGATSTSRMTAMAEIGKQFGVGYGLQLTPRAQVGWSSTRLDGFSETGGELALSLDDVKVEQVEARFGAKLGGAMSSPLSSSWTLVPAIQADYVRLLDGADSGMTVRFAVADDVPIALPLASGDASWGEVRGGVKLVRGGLEIGAGVETSFGRDNAPADERAIANVTLRF